MTKISFLISILASLAFFTTSTVYVDAAPHKKQRKVAKKRNVVKKKPVYHGAAKYTKNDPTYCNGPTCSLPGGCPTDPATAQQVQNQAQPVPQQPAMPAQPEQHPAVTPVQSAPVQPALAQTPQPVVAQPVELHHDAPKANEPEDKYNNHLGFYVGLAGSIYQVCGEHSLAITNATVTNAGYSKAGLSKFSLGGDVHLGYLHKMGNWGFGAEFYYDPTTLRLKENLNIDATNQVYELSMKGTMGLCAKIGYYMSDRTFVFGRVGYEQQKLNVKITGTTIANVNMNQNSSGMTFGFGTRYMLTTNWAMGVEYVYGLYRKKIFSAIAGAQTTTTNIRPTNHAIRFSIGYVF
ncbi:MAG: hypothetical protein CNLJKLNK_01161 [Holosporales bacterium]